MKLRYSLASTYSAEGITLGGTESGVTEFVFELPKGVEVAPPGQFLTTKEQLKAFLAHPSTVFRMKNKTIIEVTGFKEGEGEVITLEDDESETPDESEVEETEESEGTPAKRSRARRS